MKIESSEQGKDNNLRILHSDPEFLVREAMEKLNQDRSGNLALSTEDFKALTKEVYNGFVASCTEAGGEAFAPRDINLLYNYFLGKEEELIVRREIPERVFSLVNENKAIQVESGQLGFSEYPNCSLFGGMSKDVQGINLAFNEGWGEAGGVVTVIGFHNNEKDMTVVELPGEQAMQAGQRRDKVRSFTGDINKDDLAFIIIRVPNSLGLAAEPTEGFYSFTGFVFNEDSLELRNFLKQNKKEAPEYRKAS